MCGIDHTYIFRRGKFIFDNRYMISYLYASSHSQASRSLKTLKKDIIHGNAEGIRLK